MGRWQEDHGPLLSDRNCAKTAVVERAPKVANIDPAVYQGFALLVPVQPYQIDLHLGVLVFKRLDRRGDAQPRSETYRQMLCAPRDFMHATNSGVRCSEERRRRALQLQSGGGECDGSCCALEQVTPELTLERPNLPAEN